MRFTQLCSLAIASVFSTAAFSAPAIDNDADIIYLQKSCALPGGGFQDNCFTTTSAVTTWLWGGGANDRNQLPSANDRVVVRVGAGSFSTFACDHKGYVSVVGSGREQTRIENLNSNAKAIDIDSCDSLDFSNLTAHACIAVLWEASGSSTWTDVDMIGGDTGTNCIEVHGWSDNGPQIEAQKAKHFFFGSRAIAHGNNGSSANTTAFNAYDSENWFYGGDILTDVQGTPDINTRAVLINEIGDLRVFGSTIRLLVNVTSTSGGVLNGVENLNTFHMHGGIINVSTNNSSVDVDAVGIFNMGTTHTPETAFNIKPAGNGKGVRIFDANGTAMTPFLWPSSPTPPAAGEAGGTSLFPAAFNLADGYDMFVDTDAGPNGGENHLMVNDKSCTGAGGPWRDMTNGACRQ